MGLAQDWGFGIALLGMWSLAGCGTGGRTANGSAGTWVSAGLLVPARFGHTATRLADGKVLVAGGLDGHDPNGMRRSELYDPSTGAWRPASDMGQARFRHTATLLPNGRVLVVGGGSLNGASAEFFDPATGRWSDTGQMVQARAGHTATLLPDGRVLVVGGGTPFGISIMKAGSEVYDPGTGAWTWAGSLSWDRTGHTATQVGESTLVVGGYSYDAGPTVPTFLRVTEAFDPGGWTWRAMAPLASGRFQHTATSMPEGKVLVVGGWVGAIGMPDGVEVYNPSSESWSLLARMRAPRRAHGAVLMTRGKLLLAGGVDDRGYLVAATECLDPDTGLWESLGVVNQLRTEPTLTLLFDGQVLMVGGQGADGGPVGLAERFIP